MARKKKHSNEKTQRSLKPQQAPRARARARSPPSSPHTGLEVRRRAAGPSSGLHGGHVQMIDTTGLLAPRTTRKVDSSAEASKRFCRGPSSHRAPCPRAETRPWPVRGRGRGRGDKVCIKACWEGESRRARARARGRALTPTAFVGSTRRRPQGRTRRR